MQNRARKSDITKADLANRFEALLNECTPSVMARCEAYASAMAHAGASASAMVGGSPCQAFSQAGKREGLRHARG